MTVWWTSRTGCNLGSDVARGCGRLSVRCGNRTDSDDRDFPKLVSRCQRRTRPAMSATHSSNPMASVTTSLHDDEGLPTTPLNIDTNVPPEGTPLTGKHASSLPFTSTHILRDERVTAMRFEISGRVVGPVLAREFLDRYLPGENAPPLLSLDPEAQIRMTKLTQEMKEVGKETNMYGIWVIVTFCRSFCI